MRRILINVLRNNKKILFRSHKIPHPILKTPIIRINIIKKTLINKINQMIMPFLLRFKKFKLIGKLWKSRHFKTINPAVAAIINNLFAGIEGNKE